MSQNKAKSEGRRVSPNFFLRLFDACSGVFVELFDPRLLTVAITVLIAYCTLFTQRKWTGRWMEYIALGLVLIAFVAFVARTPDMRRRVRWQPLLPALWFALHGWMLLSGCFFEDWLPEALALLVAYPFLFAVFTARDDQSTLYAVLRGAVYAILPFLVWSYISKPLVIGYPGFGGVFFNPNGLGMCSTVFSACALLLAYDALHRGIKRSAIWYGALCLVGSVTVALTMSRSAYVAYGAVMLVLLGCLLVPRAKRPGRVVAVLAAVALVAASVVMYVGVVKARQTIEDNYNTAVRMDNKMHWGIFEPNPETHKLTLDDLTSSRTQLWREALTHLTLNGHETAVIEEWAAINGGGNRRNAHNAFVGVAYNNGWPAGLLLLAYTGVALWRAWGYYWRRKDQPVALAPLLTTILFILIGMFESVYAPFSVVGCTYLLMQGVLWRDDSAEGEGKDEAAA